MSPATARRFSELGIEPLLSRKEVAAWLGISERKVSDEVHAGALKCVRVNRKTIRFDRDHVREYIAQCVKIYSPSYCRRAIRDKAVRNI